MAICYPEFSEIWNSVGVIFRQQQVIQVRQEENMQKMNVASRLQLMMGLSVLIMLVLAAINWTTQTRLAQQQDIAIDKSLYAGLAKNASGLGAQAYRIIADTYINRSFDEVQKKWAALASETDRDLNELEKGLEPGEQRAFVQSARKSLDEIRRIYTTQYLPLAKKDAPRDDIGPVDDQIDKLIDKYDESLSQLAENLKKEATAADQEFDQAARSSRLWSAVAVGLGGAAMVLLVLVIARSITTQLGMELRDAVALAHRIAAGDLSQSVALKGADNNSLASALSSMVDTLQRLVTQVRMGAQGVAAASSQIAQGNHDLSHRTEQQAGALEETASSMEMLGSNVKQSAQSAQQVNRVAQDASVVARKGGQVVAEVVETMKGINDSSRRISDIISVIDGIAFQTNILALNAAVEAARAGEQGRGFAVVASEVRSLAGRSANAAKEIKGLITASVERVEQGTALVDQAGLTMGEVVQAIQRVTDIMGEMSATSAQQSAEVLQVGEAVSSMDQVTQQNAALVEEIAAAASNLESQANDLVRLVAEFKVGGSDAGWSGSMRGAAAAPARRKPAPGARLTSAPAESLPPAQEPPRLN